MASNDRWMYLVAALAFVVLLALGVWWMHAIGAFNQTVSFRYAALGVFLFCAAIILINIVMRLPMVFRWLRGRLQR
jgi:hypothetical protein